jgi:hypothetical protein
MVGLLGRPAGRPVPAPLCERAAPPPGGLPWRAARASPLCTSGPRAWARVCAPLASCAAAWVLRPGQRPAPRRPAFGHRVRGIGRVLRFSYSPSPLCGARVVPLGPPRGLAATAGSARRRRGSSPRRAASASPPRIRSVDWDGFSASSTSHLHCAARVWSLWAAAPARSNLRCGDGRGTCPTLPGLRQAGPSPRGG